MDRYGTELGGYDEFGDRQRHQAQYRSVGSFTQMTVCLKLCFKYLFAVNGGGESDQGSAGSRGEARAPTRPPARSRRPAQPAARPRPTAQLVWQQRVPAFEEQ